MMTPLASQKNDVITLAADKIDLAFFGVGSLRFPTAWIAVLTLCSAVPRYHPLSQIWPKKSCGSVSNISKQSREIEYSFLFNLKQSGYPPRRNLRKSKLIDYDVLCSFIRDAGSVRNLPVCQSDHRFSVCFLQSKT
jgi:hypothetical protein